MAREFNGSNQYLSASSTLLTDEPIDMLAHANSDSTAANQTVISLGNNGATGLYQIALLGAVASDPVRAQKQNDAGTSGFADVNGYLASVWNFVSGRFGSNTSRDSFLNTSTSNNTTNVTDPTPDFISVGVLRRSGLAQYFDGKIAEVYVLDANMSDDQHAMAGIGISPLWFMPVANIRAWYPLLGNDNNNMANGYPDLTATNSPTQVEHPANIFFPQIGGEMSF